MIRVFSLPSTASILDLVHLFEKLIDQKKLIPNPRKSAPGASLFYPAI
jgi:hypothetical protein